MGRVRSGNEDTFRMDAERGLFLVADGMGGHAAGEVASALAADALAAHMAAALDGGARGPAVLEAFRAAFLAARGQIDDCCRDQPRTRGMGTTLTACVLDPAGRCHVAHIGDSRLYHLRGGTLVQVTHDHTWVQREVDQGRLAPEAAPAHPLSHILTRVLTDDGDPEPDVLSTPVGPGDLLLLASDGLYNMLPDARIAELIATDAPLPARVKSLIREANRAGGADNVTVVLLRLA